MTPQGAMHVATEAMLECEIDHLLWRLALEGVGPAELLELDVLDSDRPRGAAITRDGDEGRLP